MKLESSDSEFRSKKYPIFKISKNFKSKLGENEEENDFKHKINVLNLM